MIRFLEPWWLLTIVPVLALGGVYAWRQLHRRPYGLYFTNVEILQTLVPKGLGWRRHAAAVVMVAGLAMSAAAMARPAMDHKVPRERATIIVALDVSLSMEATDVAPSRIRAAQEAAKEFVEQLPESFNIGLVSFAKHATVLVFPGKDKEAMLAAIDGLQLAESTATGEAVFTALQAIQSVPEDGVAGAPPARIVLMSDGFRTFGRSLEEASLAAQAAEVPVSTIAFGTDEGTVEINGQTTRVPVDRIALEKLATDTKGHYYEAVSGEELKRVYQDMGSSIGYRIVSQDISRWFIGAGLLLVLIAAGFSVAWTSRLL